MPDLGDIRENSQRHRYIVRDPETQGTYQVVASVSKTPDEVDAVVAGVIQDEGRVAAGVSRTIYV